jgi:O-methyltransferase involved in polyketide biosynthesis
MQHDKVRVKLTGISETPLFPLWARAKISRDHPLLFCDAKAVELVEKIDYDFSTLAAIPFEGNLLPIVARARHFDDRIKAYMTAHPHASVVNIGAGLDTTFYRVDNGAIHWYDLDLPPVIAFRKELIPETDRSTCIAQSFLDPSWCADVAYRDGVFMVAGGVLRYFDESRVKQLLAMLADNFPGGEIVFNVSSRKGNFRAWLKQLTPQQRKELSVTLKDTLADRWQKAPQDQKERLLAALRLPTTPHSVAWAALETRWDQLSAEKTDEALVELWHDYRALSNWGKGKWALADADEITKWDSRITVVDQFSVFKDFPRDSSLSIDAQRFIDFSSKHGRSKIVHLRL